MVNNFILIENFIINSILTFLLISSAYGHIETLSLNLTIVKHSSSVNSSECLSYRYISLKAIFNEKKNNITFSSKLLFEKKIKAYKSKVVIFIFTQDGSQSIYLTIGPE